MGTDTWEFIGMSVSTANNVTINLGPDGLATIQRLFAALAEGGADVAGLDKMFWGADWGTCCDRFGVR
jgi:PhnB protein